MFTLIFYQLHSIIGARYYFLVSLFLCPGEYKIKIFLNFSKTNNVRIEGLEPPRLAAPDPKSGAATNYAISAIPNFYSLLLHRVS